MEEAVGTRHGDYIKEVNRRRQDVKKIESNDIV